jgi:hypothetical protein
MVGWGGVNNTREGGGLVGRRVVGRLGVGRSFPKKKLIQGRAKFFELGACIIIGDGGELGVH